MTGSPVDRHAHFTVRAMQVAGLTPDAKIDARFQGLAIAVSGLLYALRRACVAILSRRTRPRMRRHSQLLAITRRDGCKISI